MMRRISYCCATANNSAVFARSSGSGESRELAASNAMCDLLMMVDINLAMWIFGWTKKRLRSVEDVQIVESA